MPYSPELVAELSVLALFDLNNSLSGLKIHHQSASAEAVEAARRLHAKALLSQPDGGYLTGLGRDAAEHAQALLTILEQPSG